MKYKVKFSNFGGIGFNSKRTEYEPGEPVEVTYNAICTDTSFTFHANVDEKNVKYKDGCAIISFIMPDHDVEVTVESRNVMTPLNNGPYGPMTGIGMMMFDPDKQPERPAMPTPEAEKWTCKNCGPENKGRFCTECGTPKPVDDTTWICPACKTENHGKFCAGCGMPKGKQ